MRRLFLEQYHKQIFPSISITSFSPFLSYIVVTPLMLGFERDFSCHSHLGPIRIPPLFPFPSAPFPRNEKEDGTLELYYLSASCLQKNAISIIARSPGYSNKLCFLWFPHVTTSVPIRSIRNGSVKHSIREHGLDFSVWYSFSFSSKNHIQQWLQQLTNFATSPASLHQPFLVPLLKRNGFMFFHQLVIPLHSYLFFQFWSQLVHKIEWKILR